jgi:hypothetical protein
VCVLGYYYVEIDVHLRLLGILLLLLMMYRNLLQ